VTGDGPPVAGFSNERQAAENIQSRKVDTLQNSRIFAGNTEDLLTTFLQGFLTVADVAKHLSISRSTVYHLCELGELKHVRVSNAIRVPVQAVADYVRRRTPA
jgi:excisionase family DNA binding protein